MSGALECDSYYDGLRLKFCVSVQMLVAEVEASFWERCYTIVGVSFFTTQFWDIHQLMQSLKNKFGRKPFYLAGGPHPTGGSAGTLALGLNPSSGVKESGISFYGNLYRMISRIK